MRRILMPFWIVAAVFLCCRNGSEDNLFLADDFESGHLAGFWLAGDKGEGRYEEEAVAITEQYHCSGTHSVRLVLKKGFVRQDGGDGRFTERTELDSRAHALSGQDVWYKFSLLIPAGFPIVDNRLIISQVKQARLLSDPFQLYAHRFRNGRHYLTIYDMTSRDKKEKATVDLPALSMETWHDFVFHVRFSEAPTGRVKVWMDGRLVVDFSGATASPDGRNRFYHKIGLYRDEWPDPMELYFDDYLMTTDSARIDTRG